MDLFIARQPIVDVQRRIAGYELLYRSNSDSVSADGASSEQMSLDVVVHAFLDIGLDRITHGRTAFLNFSREMILNGSFELLDRDEVVIELLETVEADEPIIEACARMRKQGYQLALDDFTGDKGHRNLIDMADIIKIDVLNRPVEELAEVTKSISRDGMKLLAERVETMQIHEACRGLGFELFQGYFYSRPQIVGTRSLRTDQLAILRLMNLLYDENTPDTELEAAFRGNPGLSYRLLRMVNSASQGGRGIESIGHAIRLVGRSALHRWLALLLASSASGRGDLDQELIQSTLLRARFCEKLGAGRMRSGPFFILGLFSRMDVLLRIPLEEILEQVHLAEEVKEALLHGSGPYADLLRLADAYETGDWEQVEALCRPLRIAAAEIPLIYLEALHWSRQQIRALMDAETVAEE